MVREAKYSDIENINKLGILLNKKFVNLFDMTEILNEKYSEVLVYEKESQILGFIHATHVMDTMDIVNIVVEENNRHQGIGSLLLDYLISKYDTELKQVTLEVNSDNKIAIDFYESFGFKIINKRIGYYDGVDAYLMGRYKDEQ